MSPELTGAPPLIEQSVTDPEVDRQLALILDRPEVFQVPQSQALLLRYLVKRTRAGEAAPGRGTKLLRKFYEDEARYTAGHLPSDDAGRRLVGELRRTLDDYYRLPDIEGQGGGPGAYDPILIEIPKGGVKVRFERRSQARSSTHAPKRVEEPFPASSQRPDSSSDSGQKDSATDLSTGTAIASYINDLKPRLTKVSNYFVPVRWESRLDRDEDETRAAIRGCLRKGKSYKNVLEAFKEVPQAVVLSAPGGGKTTALNWLAKELADRLTAEGADPDAPVPLFASLDSWNHEDESLEDYVVRTCPAIAPHAQALSQDGRLVLLLDGLDQATRADKEDAIKDFREKLAKETPIWISCRRDDYLGFDLKLDQLIIEELTPARVRRALKLRMTVNERTAAEGEQLFWELTDPRLADALKVWLVAGGEEEDFWLPKNADVVEERIGWQRYRLWRRHVLDKHSLVRLAANPFTLRMIYVAWDEDLFRSPQGNLPQNRADIFDRFIDALLIKEKLALPDKVYGGGLPTESGERLLENLTRFAWDMQTIRIEDEETDGGDPGVLTVVDEKVALKSFKEDAESFKSALDTTVLDRRSGTNRAETEVRFRHQLLQEYFAARALDRKRRFESKKASELWPQDRWWERSGWEEVCVLLAGLYGDDCTEIVGWLAEAQPEVAAQCINEGGANIKNRRRLLLRLRVRWLPRLTDLDREPEPGGRAAVGRALGRLRIGDGTSLGEPLDIRPGVDLKDGLPDLLWVRIPGGDFLYGEHDAVTHVDSFEISRYPLTNVQWELFLEAEDGYRNDRWWEGLTDPIREREMTHWSETNCPRVNVSWYEAMAFCDWLTHKLQDKGLSKEAVTLPTDKQWERAARGVDGRLYPWGGRNYRSGYANVNEFRIVGSSNSLGCPSPVGIYPQGSGPDRNPGDHLGVLDMTGNVWEWCLNEAGSLSELLEQGYNPERTQRSGGEYRVMRGGSCLLVPRYGRASLSSSLHPRMRTSSLGFRVVRHRPIAVR